MDRESSRRRWTVRKKDKYSKKKEQNLEASRADAEEGRLVPTALPRSLYVDINLKCNLQCPQCHRNHPQFEGHEWPTMDFSLFKRVADELFPTAYRVILSGGGESLVHKQIDRILEICVRYGVYPTIYSNGTTMTPKRGMLLAKSGAYLGISIDGASRETFEALRFPAKWDRLMRSLDIIRDTREQAGGTGFFPFFTVVVQKANLQELSAFVDLADRYGFEQIKYTKIYPHFEELEERVPEPEEASRAFVEVLERANEKRVRVEVPDYGETGVSARLAELRSLNVFPVSLDDSPAGPYVSGGFVKYPDAESSRCEIPFSEAMITPEGKVVVGCCSQYQLGDLADSTFAEIWNGDSYRELRKTVNSSEPMEFCRPGTCPFRS